MKKEAGFTLIEIIVTVILLGIMAAVGSMLIAQGAKGYIRAKANDELSQQVQLALDRMILEFEDISLISAVSETDPDYICYTLTYYDVPTASTIDVNRCMGRVGNQIMIVNGTDHTTIGTGSVLIAGVSAFQLDFYSPTDAFTGSGTWTLPADHNIANLASIKITLTLNRTDSTDTYTCSTVYDVRRNGRVGLDDEPINWNL